MDTEELKFLILTVIVSAFIFENILNWLNVNRKSDAVPSSLTDYLSLAKLQKSNHYRKVNYRFGLASGIFGFLLTLIFVGGGLFGLLDEWLGNYISHPIWLSLVFFGVVFLGSDLLSIPFDYYKTFVIEERFGFNKTSRATFFMDKMKGWALSILIGGGLLFLLLWLLDKMGTSFWWQFWLIASVFMVLANLFYTSLVLPLFNRLSPLEDGELKFQILQYAQKVDFSLTNIMVMDGSARSSKANAFFSGFGNNKKVVLYDTLIEQNTPQQLVAVLAHEIGHYKKHHILMGLVMGIAQIGLLLFILSVFVFNETISLALGGSQMSVHLNLIGFSLLYSPISILTGVGMNLLSRKNEFQADRYAMDTYAGLPLAEALKSLSINNLSHINPHPWYVFVHYSHPPLLERLEKLE